MYTVDASSSAATRTALVTGASGYVGRQLVPRLLAEGWRVRVLTRSRASIQDHPWAESVEVFEGDAADADMVSQAMVGTLPASAPPAEIAPPRGHDTRPNGGAIRGGMVKTRSDSAVDVAYYLIHSIGGSHDFTVRDRELARSFAAAAEQAGVRRIVYLGGLHPDGTALSPHLASRVEVGQILLASGVPTAVLQAAVIVGNGSASFDMLRYLAGRLPAMVAPKWLNSRIQPIAVDDVLHYLVGAACLPDDVNRTFDIGGHEVMTYRDMLQAFARVTGLRRRLIVTLPVLTPGLASHWVGLVTPIASGLAKPLVGSLVHDVVCREHDISGHIPDPAGGLTGFDEAVHTAMADTTTDHGLRDFVAVMTATAASATLGALATDPGGRWYRRLDLPAWQPPHVTFPVVWTLLYADIAVASACSLSTLEHQGRRDEATAYRRALVANLALNTAWGVIFWRAQRPDRAALEAGLLTLSSADLARRAGRARTGWGRTLAPYPLWCGFATALSTAIARRNRRS